MKSVLFMSFVVFISTSNRYICESSAVGRYVPVIVFDVAFDSVSDTLISKYSFVSRIHMTDKSLSLSHTLHLTPLSSLYTLNDTSEPSVFLRYVYDVKSTLLMASIGVRLLSERTIVGNLILPSLSTTNLAKDSTSNHEWCI